MESLVYLAVFVYKLRIVNSQNIVHVKVNLYSCLLLYELENRHPPGWNIRHRASLAAVFEDVGTHL